MTEVPVWKKRKNPETYAELFSKLKVQGSYYLSLRDLPILVSKFVTGTNTLDYGCGPATSTLFLKSLGLTVKGIDISAAMIQKARTKDPEGEYRVIQNMEIPDDNNQYDFVFANWVLLEIGSKEELYQTMCEIFRVLKPNGTFITTVASEHQYNKDFLNENTQFSENINLISGCQVKKLIKDVNLIICDYFWTNEDYQESMKAAGLNVVYVHEPLGLDEDDYQWKSEKTLSPIRIYVAKK
ncbi:hypothetical protein PGB90_006714 [Kerria lacca]